MHAIEWIERNAKFQRTISAVRLRVGLKRQPGHCTWCDKKFTTSNALRWCSAECREAGYLRFGFFRGPVENRDRGICAICGFDSLRCQQRLKRLMSRAKGSLGRRTFPCSYSRLRRWSRRTRIFPIDKPYEIDHIIPVSEGGGCCGLENLRTLCFVCHRKETAKLRKRLAELRRDSNRPLLCS